MVRLALTWKQLPRCSRPFTNRSMTRIYLSELQRCAICGLRTHQPTSSIKSTDDLSHITLTENPDIIQSVANANNRPNLVVGFAAETDDMLAHAAQKLTAKSLDIIIANCVENGQIFGQDDTQATILSSRGDPLTVVSGPKSQVAIDILNTLSERLTTRI